MALKVKLIIVPMTPETYPRSSLQVRKTNLCREGKFAKFSVAYLKRVLPETFGIGYNRRNTLAQPIFFLTVTRMSQCIIICPSCERELLNDDQVLRTPRGRIVCQQCAQETYLDVPLA